MDRAMTFQQGGERPRAELWNRRHLGSESYLVGVGRRIPLSYQFMIGESN